MTKITTLKILRIKNIMYIADLKENRYDES